MNYIAMNYNERNYSDLIREIKQDEGFRDRAYKDSLGKDTIGYGTLLPLDLYEQSMCKNADCVDEMEADALLQHRLEKMIIELRKSKGKIIDKIGGDRRVVIFNMLYQMGVKGVLNFKKMWAALEKQDFKKAADEMRDSRWYIQTPNRAKRLIKIMAGRV